MNKSNEKKVVKFYFKEKNKLKYRKSGKNFQPRRAQNCLNMSRMC
jgi:hypothetical protein